MQLYHQERDRIEKTLGAVMSARSAFFKMGVLGGGVMSARPTFFRMGVLGGGVMSARPTFFKMGCRVVE
jgi:hypothetical protein